VIQLKTIDKSFSLAEREQHLNIFRSEIQQTCVALQTCNRLEIYYGEGTVPGPVAHHLFRVVAGLESSLVGEMAIQGQVKAAYVEACCKFDLNKGLHSLFQTALFVGKRVRTETGISRGAVSHSLATVDIIAQSGIDLNKALITIIGAHKLNEDIIKFLLSKGAETIFLGNKSFDKAQSVASNYGCQVFRLDQLKEFLAFTDVLITATAAPHLIVNLQNFPIGKKMMVFDLAFPRDVDERIGAFENVKLYDLEKIERKVNQNLEKRTAEIEKAEMMISEEVTRFLKKQNNYAINH
jgi:glutamyl-tRNA reductase